MSIPIGVRHVCFSHRNILALNNFTEVSIRMRSFFRVLRCVMIVPFATFLMSCNKSDSTVIYQLTLSEGSVVFDMAGGVKELGIIPFPENEPWEAAYDGPSDWFTFEAGQQSLIVTAQPNYDTDSRSGSIILTSPQGNFEQYEVAVYQEAAQDLEFSTTASDHKFDSEGGEVTYTVSSNYKWTMEYDADWLTVIHYPALEQMVIECRPNESDESRSAILTMSAGYGAQEEIHEIVITQGTRAENPYFKLLGQWEITATKWYYSPNGSLNNLDYAPNQTDYYLIFDMEQGEYGKTLIMKDFLYPDTELEVRYDKETGNIVIPFGWTVYSYDVFLYLTLVSDKKFSYASLEVDGIPSEDFTSISLDLPTVDGWNYVGFGLWTYNDSGSKVALGSRSRPTMFPMGPIAFKKQSL